MNVLVVNAGSSSLKYQLTLAILNHRTAISLVLGTLLANEAQAPIDAIGHRIVHGGSFFKRSCLVDEDVLRKIEEIAPLAPLHNYAAASVIESCIEVLPQVPNVVAFDTSFHSTIPEVAYRYPLPEDLCEELHLRDPGRQGCGHDDGLHPARRPHDGHALRLDRPGDGDLHHREHRPERP